MPKQTVLQLKFSPSNLRSAYYHSVQNLLYSQPVPEKETLKDTQLYFSSLCKC